MELKKTGLNKKIKKNIKNIEMTLEICLRMEVETKSRRKTETRKMETRLV